MLVPSPSLTVPFRNPGYKSHLRWRGALSIALHGSARAEHCDWSTGMRIEMEHSSRRDAHHVIIPRRTYT